MTSETWNISNVVPEAPRGSTLQNHSRRRWVLIANQQLQEILLVGIFLNFYHLRIIVSDSFSPSLRAFDDSQRKKGIRKTNRLLNSFRMDFLFEDSRTINVRFTDEVLRIKSAVQVGYYAGRFSK